MVVGDFMIISVLSGIADTLAGLIVGLVHFISNILSLPTFLGSLFLTLPDTFSLGFAIIFSFIVLALVVHIYSLLKG